MRPLLGACQPAQCRRCVMIIRPRLRTCVSLSGICHGSAFWSSFLPCSHAVQPVHLEGLFRPARLPPSELVVCWGPPLYLPGLRSFVASHDKRSATPGWAAAPAQLCPAVGYSVPTAQCPVRQLVMLVVHGLWPRTAAWCSVVVFAGFQISGLFAVFAGRAYYVVDVRFS